MSDPFADFAGMTLGNDGKYAQPGVGGGQPGVQPPVAPMLAKDDPWGLVYQQQNGGTAPAPAAAEPAAINIMATPAPAPTPVMNAPPMGAPGGVNPAMNNAAPMAAAPMAAAPMAAQPAPAPVPATMNNALVPSQTPSPGVMAGIAQPGPGAMVPAPPPPDNGLPPGWTAYNDPSSGKEYYSNAATGQVTWDKPAPVAMVTAPAAAPPAAADPFGAPAPAPAPAAAASDPFSVFGGGAAAATTEIVPSAQPAGDDPFGVFGGAIPAPVAAQTEAPPPAPYDVPLSPAKSDVSEMTADPAGGVPENLPHEEDDFWAQMGFEQDKPKDPSPEKPKPAASDQDDKRAQMKSRKSYVRHSIINIPNQAAAAVADENAGREDRIDKDGLPPGKTYSVELDRNTFKLGAIFMTAWQLQPTLYGKVSDKVVKALGQRPVIAYLSLAGAVNKANIEIGEILLKVNGKDATDPKQARDLVQSQEHPLTLTMHRPSLPIMLAENQHMVKYDNSKARAPSHLQGWKAKYVVVGGLGAKPWALLMYYSKFDYDRAIAANLAKRPVGHEIKIKAFDLRGCKLVENQQVSYPETHSTWHFFMIVPPTESRDGPFFPNVIKISHPEPEGLIPVLEAVKRVLKKYPTRPEKQHVTVARAQPRNVTMY